MPDLLLVNAFVPASHTPTRTRRHKNDDGAFLRQLHVLCALSDFSIDVSIPTNILTLSSSFLPSSTWLEISRDQAEQAAGPFFGASLLPYLAFLWLLARPENSTPKGVTVGFATCLLFVFLTIPAAIAAQVLYGVSLADSDWLHGSAESLLTVTNLVTVVAFRQALAAKEAGSDTAMPRSATEWSPMIWLVVGLTVVASATAVVPALAGADVHTPYLGGFLDLPIATATDNAGGNSPFFQPATHVEPDNALTVATWIIHISSLVEFLVAMGFCWRWADVTGNPTWKGLTWGLLPLHSSGITACVYHLFYNRIPVLVPLQALLTCVGNTTAAMAAYRIARSNGWTPTGEETTEEDGTMNDQQQWIDVTDRLHIVQDVMKGGGGEEEDGALLAVSEEACDDSFDKAESTTSLVGFEDLGQALADDNDYSFLFKLFAGCAVASYAIKYGEVFFDFPFDANVYAGFAFIFVPSALNAYKWYRRGEDPTFEGWF